MGLDMCYTPRTSRMIFARLSVHLSDFLPTLNWKDMTRSWIGMIRRKSEKPASAEGPSYGTQVFSVA